MKKIKVGHISGSGFEPGEETILYETKEEIVAGGLNPIDDDWFDDEDFYGVVKGVDKISIIVTDDSDFDIIKQKTSLSEIIKTKEKYLNNQKLIKDINIEIDDLDKQVEEIKKRKSVLGDTRYKTIIVNSGIRSFFDALNISLDEDEGEVEVEEVEINEEKCPLEKFLIANNLVEKFMDGRYSNDNDLALEEHYNKYGRDSIQETNAWWNSEDHKDVDWEDVDESFRNYLDTL